MPSVFLSRAFLRESYAKRWTCQKGLFADEAMESERYSLSASALEYDCDWRKNRRSNCRLPQEQFILHSIFSYFHCTTAEIVYICRTMWYNMHYQ